MIGELPMLYDEQHLGVLREKTGIKVSFIKKLDSSAETFGQIINENLRMLFVNKMTFMVSTSNPMRKCVSTIIAEKLNDDIYRCHTFDKDLEPIQQTDIETLYNSWMCASDYEQLNQCIISVETPAGHTNLNSQDVSKECMRTSLASYMHTKNKENISYGYDGIKKFSDDILSWDNNDFQKLIDSAMYMDILVKQRVFFILSLKKLSIQNKDSILEVLDTLIENWNRLKMLLFIVGTRKQNGARQQLSKIISELGDFEYNAVSNMMEALR
jgi:hypothetical protein